MNTTNHPEPESPPPSGTPSPAPPLHVICRKCRNPIGEKDTYCRHCGTAQHVKDPFYYHPIWILFLAFFILGPFALGLVWRSRAMDRPTKFVLATIIIVYTIVTFYLAYKVGIAVYREFSMISDFIQ